jgi:hypothetical protein
MEINIIGTMFYGNDAMQKNHFRSKFFMVRENMPASYRMQYVYVLHGRPPRGGVD